MKKIVFLLLVFTLAAPVFAEKVNTIRCFSGIPTDLGNPEPRCFIDTLRNIDEGQRVTVYFHQGKGLRAEEGKFVQLTLEGNIKIEQDIGLFMMSTMYTLQSYYNIPLKDIAFVLVDGDGE